jgi:glyoxylase-like metal-dependent hydrolase (beta-lactamase superfamily II)
LHLSRRTALRPSRRRRWRNPRSGEAIAREVVKLTKNTDVYIVNTHFHPEHTTGDAAFPKAKIVRAAAQQQDIEEMGMKWVSSFASRSREMAEILRGATFRNPDQVFEKETTLDLGGVRVRVMRLGPDTRAAIP